MLRAAELGNITFSPTEALYRTNQSEASYYEATLIIWQHLRVFYSRYPTKLFYKYFFVFLQIFHQPLAHYGLAYIISLSLSYFFHEMHHFFFVDSFPLTRAEALAARRRLCLQRLAPISFPASLAPQPLHI